MGVGSSVKQWFDKVLKVLDVAELAVGVLVLLVAFLMLLGRALYLAWK